MTYLRPPASAARGAERHLAAARRGDEDAFRRVVEPHLRGLRAHCYRMLGSAHDADDAVQETLLKASRGLEGFEGRSSFRSWLYRIATTTCLNMMNRDPRRVLRLEGQAAGDPLAPAARPLTESFWLEPLPDDLTAPAPESRPEARYDERESVELAFVAALQYLPPRQRAVLVLRDVLGFSGAEVATMLDTIPSSVYSLLQRAHAAIDARVPDISQQQTLRALGDETVRTVVERYIEAWERNDARSLATLLADDAVLAMPPTPTWFHGRDAVTTFLGRWPLSSGSRWRLRQTVANGQLAFGCYRFDPALDGFGAYALQVLTMASTGDVAELTVFMDERDLTRFGLPVWLPSS